MRRLSWHVADAVRRSAIAPVMRPVTSSGELCAIGLSATFSPRRSTTTRSATANTSGMRWLISTTAMRVVAQAPDQAQHLGDLAHADRGGRLVHQHDLRVRQPRARDGDGLALAAGHAAHQVARPRLRLQLGEQLAGALEHRAVVDPAQRPEAAHQLAAEEHVLGRASGCRTARGPGRRSRCPARARVGRLVEVHRLPCIVIVPALGGKLPAMILTSVDLPAPLSPISPTTSPACRASDTPSARGSRRSASRRS